MQVVYSRYALQAMQTVSKPAAAWRRSYSSIPSPAHKHTHTHHTTPQHSTAHLNLVRSAMDPDTTVAAVAEKAQPNSQKVQ